MHKGPAEGTSGKVAPAGPGPWHSGNDSALAHWHGTHFPKAFSSESAGETARSEQRVTMLRSSLHIDQLSKHYLGLSILALAIE